MTEYSKGEIHVLPDLEAVSRQAASLFMNASRIAITEKMRFTVAISGGSTPRKLYGLLGSEEYRHQMDWPRVHFFWVDERCVPKEHEESNFKAAFDAFLSKISIPDGNIHRIKGEEFPGKAAQEYQEELWNFFGRSGIPLFDLIILGVGEDGHTASLFPGSEALGEKERWVVPIYLKKPKINRITLTLPVLNNASQTLFLVSGPSKATVLSEIIENEHNRVKYPAGLIDPVHGDVLWLIDHEAAGKLSKQGKT
jgi:6-phosphogluconolactonase